MKATKMPRFTAPYSKYASSPPVSVTAASGPCLRTAIYSFVSYIIWKGRVSEHTTLDKVHIGIFLSLTLCTFPSPTGLKLSKNCGYYRSMYLYKSHIGILRKLLTRMICPSFGKYSTSKKNSIIPVTTTSFKHMGYVLLDSLIKIIQCFSWWLFSKIRSDAQVIQHFVLLQIAKHRAQRGDALCRTHHGIFWLLEIGSPCQRIAWQSH